MKSRKTYIILGDPTPLARHRMKNGMAYDSQRHLKFSMGIQIKAQHDNLPLFKGPIHLDVTFYFKLAKSQQNKRNEIYETYYIGRCDLDNCIKFIGDVCNGLLYEDDRTISQISAKKLYSDIPRTEFTIYELE